MRRHRQSLWTNIYLSFAAAVTWGIICMLTLTLIFSTFSYSMLKTLEFAGAFAIVAISVSGYSSGYLYGRYRRRNGLIHGGVCGILLYIGISAAGIIAAGSPSDIKKLPLLVFAAAAGGVAGVNTKRPKNLKDQ